MTDQLDTFPRIDVNELKQLIQVVNKELFGLQVERATIKLEDGKYVVTRIELARSL